MFYLLDEIIVIVDEERSIQWSFSSIDEVFLATNETFGLTHVRAHFDESKNYTRITGKLFSVVGFYEIQTFQTINE